MSRFEFSLEPPAQWERFCAEHHALFHSVRWQHLLDTAFGSTTVYGWNHAEQLGLAISVFSAGPFRIGYLGFPVGGAIGASQLESDTVMSWAMTRFPKRIDCLRLPVSGFDHGTTLVLPGVANPETAIVALKIWDTNALPKIRRDINKAQRSPIEVHTATDPTLGTSLHRLYRTTVARRGAQARYNESYFRALIELSHQHQGLTCLTATHENELAAFVVTARHGDTVYYLHGASEPTLKHHGASDLLLHEAIVRAKNQYAQCFNLMTSPSQQTSLIRYKEKWGSETRTHVTYTLPINKTTCSGFRMAEWLYRQVR